MPRRPPSRPVRRLPLLAAPVLVVPVLVATGCGSGSEDAEVETRRTDDLVPVVARAAAATGDATTGRFEMTVSTEVAPLGEVDLTAEGAYDAAAGRATVTMDLASALGGLADALGADEGEGGTSGDLGDLLGGSWTVVVDGGTTYLDMGGLGSMLGAGDGWVSVPSEADAMGATPMGPVGAEEVLDVLAGVADVTEVGSEEVRGVDTTHYSATVDVDVLLDRAAADAEVEGVDPADVQAALDAFEAAGVEVADLPVDVWVDGDGLVRRVTVSTTVAGALDDAVTTETTVEYFDLGEPVDIAVPDPSEVTPIDPESLAGGAGLGDLFDD